MADSAELARKARANSVQQLCELYNVVIGVALSVGVYRAFAPDEGPSVLNSNTHLSHFVTFIALIIPFYHGAVRHLFATYVEPDASRRIKSWAVFFDFLVLFGEGCVFVFLSAYIGDIEMFLWGVIALLTIDCAWGTLATIGFAGSSSQEAEKKWAILNFGTVCAILLFDVLIVKGIYGWEAQIAYCLLLIIAARTVIDYARSWKFYFPPLEP